MLNIPKPCADEVEHYLNEWNTLKKYVLQEDALNKLFNELCPKNDSMADILIKVSTLNDFYSTNIKSTVTVAEHILRLNIDERLENCDEKLVNDIAGVVYENGRTIRHYSFASKYCSHHKPSDYPIYDSNVGSVLKHFRDTDQFSDFSDKKLKEYTSFKKIIFKFKEFYELKEYTVKEIDRYLWQVGRNNFSKYK
ncbi:hypothetical protein HNP88_000794 [Methanococcus maripaludis]|uniref:Uncharacterized protein n=1 Tax=Methanococcus maripaludis TaxID=39152 RepID=A0A7J9NNH2_METMI|nr:hypothetical protein [Methanococcus maripaludis]MBA2846610.1 hypothetical protein [Methanococcus maripaludis]